VSVVRGTLRALGLALATVLVGVALLGGELAGLLSRRARAWMQPRAFRAWARAAAHIIGLRIERSGTPPAGPFFLVANHLSYLDVVVLAAQLDATFVAKADVAGWPMIGRLCRAVDTVFIDRRRKRDLLRVLPLLAERLAAGGGVVVFPEGTTSPGAGVLEFRSSLFAAAARAGLPVHLATLTYRTPAGAPHPARAVCWWGEMEFVRHLLGLLRLPHFTARVEFVTAPIRAAHRKDLARAARAGIAQRFVPVIRGETTCLPTRSRPRPTSASFARAQSS
jgi:1-acyl-sn-glycerol-3-phosphate acyltransferase